ncbi:MAG: FKBP-type peptidyl-prolyl cis-trans isomerase [Candidatus Cloacimonetes bacterium]|nr:FKBP-type peptidyl-prolyl cis-trans isomerase [Candidatus Cloacimonadota bacterium]
MRSFNQKINSSQKGNTGIIFIGVGFCLLLALMTYVAGRGLGESKEEVKAEKNVEVNVTVTKKNSGKEVIKEIVKVTNMVEKPVNEKPSLSVTILEETNMPSIVMPKDGDIVSIHYQGLFENGKEFDSSYNRNEPLNFQVGAGRMIQGMDQGVKMIPIGAKAKLSIPWHLAYGEHGRPGIPPKANLIFVMEVLEVMPKPTPHVFPKPDGSKAKTLGDLKYWVLKTGNGPKPKVGQKVKVHYTGWFESGKSFDSSKKRGIPFKFNLGGRVIKGWNQMVANMSKGESVFVSIPSHLAYGPYGRGGIPGGATLLFQIDLIDFR